MNKLKQEKKERNKKDREWRKLVLESCNFKCVICGATIRPNAHHIIPRNFKETRWDVNNGIILCPKHHKFGKFSAHKNGLWFIKFLQEHDRFKYNHLINKLKELDGYYNQNSIGS